MSAYRRLQRLIFRLTAAIVRPSASHAGQPRRILVIKPDHLGDLLLATPALRALRAAFPAAHITGLVGPWSQRMWQGLSSLDELRTLAFPSYGRTAQQRSRLTLLRTTWQAAAELRRGRYDTALLLRDDDYWSALVCLLAGIPRRIGHAHPQLADLLSDAVPFAADEHVTRQALALVAQLSGQPVTATALELAVSAEEQAWAADKLANARSPIICHPGTGGAAKQWPTQHWADVIDTLQQQHYQVILSGSPNETDLLTTIAAACRSTPLQLSEDLTIGRLAALFARAQLVIGVDSGPLHIAVSQRTPSLHLFGPSDSQRFGPWGDALRHRVLRSGLFCSPCGSIAACPRATAPSECMAGIAPQQVFRAAIQLLTDIR